MCGRFSLGTDTDRLVHEFGLGTATAEVRPRYNIAPTQDAAAVVRGADGLRLGTLRWGLVPHWSKDGAGGARMINARSETVDHLPAFRDPFRARRCWVLADGFYEWQRGPAGEKTPVHIRLPGGAPFAFAGLWDRWRSPDGELLSCTILTTTPSEAVAPIHDRMPVILPAGAREEWLDPAATPAALKSLLRPYDGELEAYPVSALVNSPGNDVPECRLPA